MRWSPRPVGTYQLKYLSKFLAHFSTAREPRILIAVHSLPSTADQWDRRERWRHAPRTCGRYGRGSACPRLSARRLLTSRSKHSAHGMLAGGPRQRLSSAKRGRCRRIGRCMIGRPCKSSQQQLAAKVGAAGKAVVYQWETGRRKPSPVFWLRIERLQCQVENPRPNSNA